MRHVTGRRVRAFMCSCYLMVLAACGQVDLSWREDVQLEDGRMLLVKRTAQGKKLGEIGGPGGWEVAKMTLEIEAPESLARPPRWAEQLVPMVFDYDPSAREWYVVATFYMCKDWYRLGRPNLPYVQYRVNNGRWEQIALRPSLVGKRANLLTGVRSGGEPRRVTLDEKLRRGDKSDETFKKIAGVWHSNC